MNNIELLFYVLGGIATLIFIAGYIRGARTALATYDDERIEVNDGGDIQHFWLPIGLAVIAAATIIGLVGVIPAFIYVGPALAIFTAAMNGVAFFIEEKTDPERERIIAKNWTGRRVAHASWYLASGLWRLAQND
ncbi:MAG: hypothetical protein ACFCUR_09060 [Rhodomicrobiaceae bacterium]